MIFAITETDEESFKKAVELANKNDAYLVVRNQRIASMLNTKYSIKRFPITFEELISTKMNGSWVRNIVILHPEALLRQFLSNLTIDGCVTDSESLGRE